MPDEVSEAVEELRRQRDALESERDLFFIRIAGPIDRLSELAGKPKRDARELVEEKRLEKVAVQAGHRSSDHDADSDDDPRR
jgi:hypothetical protein